jgi:hypothetical protein
MYDSLLLAQSLIEEATKNTDIVIKPYNGYCDFQTKDLDNSLTTFFIQADGSFVWEKREYTYKEPEFTSTKNWNFGTLESVGEPEIVVDTRSAYISFYDIYTTDEERIFVTFKAHVNNGKLVEPITIESIERTNLKEEAEKHKKAREQRNKTEATWEWQLATFLNKIRWKTTRFFYPLTRTLDTLEKTLRDKAKQKSEVL